MFALLLLKLKFKLAGTFTPLRQLTVSISAECPASWQNTNHRLGLFCFAAHELRQDREIKSGGVHPPGEHQTHQGADEDEHLVEHGGVGPLDGTMEVILQAGEPVISVELTIDFS